MPYRELPETMYANVRPTPVRHPQLVLFNRALAADLNLNHDVWEHAGLLSGNDVLDEFEPLAQAYVGHQFGHLAMLGDGRAILIAEVTATDGVRYDIQLKGSGPTPFSRGGDGRAALGPMLREYLVSEAMHALGIPTSRSLAVVTTGEMVRRDTFHPGAVLTRVASSHLRVGTCQYAAGRGVIQAVADYAIKLHDPACQEEQNPYICLFQNVLGRQAHLIAKWQSVGFIHGVMNTDNMALSGETIDYGPCAFMDTYRADQVFSSIDYAGRYRYSNQPAIAKWNLARLAETLIPLVDANADQARDHLAAVLDTFDAAYKQAWLIQFGKKLGIGATEADVSLIDTFLSLLEKHKKDFTNSFIQLTDNPRADVFDDDEGRNWQLDWRKRVSHDHDPDTAQSIMAAANPRVIPRNQILDDVLRQAEAGQTDAFMDMLDVVTHPFAECVPDTYLQPAAADSLFVTYCGT